jgi:hypothetical protein
VKYTATDVNKLIKVSITPKKTSGQVEAMATASQVDPQLQLYNLKYKVPVWAPGEYQRTVFIELSISDKIRGDEDFYVYIDHVYIVDRRGYNLIKRNATSKKEYIPLVVKATPQEKYFDPRDKATLDSAGSGIVISILVAIGVNFGFSFLESGSMELLWSFLNVL